MSSLKILGCFIEKRRLEMRFTRKDLASKLGFKNLGRGIWLIDQIERGENNKKLIPRICVLLEITEIDLKRCQNEEERLIRDYRASLPPFKPHISMRLGSCSGKNFAIPDNIEKSDYLAFTIKFAKQMGQTVHLWVAINKRAKAERGI